MSRIGKNPISVPSGVEVKVDGQDVAVKGPKGELSVTIAEPITVSLEDGVITVARPDEERESRSLHGLSRTLINNMIVGVTDGYPRPSRSSEPVTVSWPRDRTSSSLSATATRSSSSRRRNLLQRRRSDQGRCPRNRQAARR